jgi:hypothetical protein
MALRRPETEEISERHTLATAKVRADKVRDWVSKARQLARIPGFEK